MEGGYSFVDVRHVYAEYAESQSFMGRLVGRAPQVQSVLRDVTFKMSLGEQVVLFGNGASGKSTLLRIMAGVLSPSRGKIWVNGASPAETKNIAAGYVSNEESEPPRETAYDILYAFGSTHGLANLPSRVGEVAEQLGLTPALNRPTATLSTTERLRLNLARAALSDSPLLLLDGIADDLGVEYTSNILTSVFAGRTTIVATRVPATAEQLNMPIMILHDGSLPHRGSRDELADAVSCARTMEVWVEGLRYDLLRKLKQHTGVVAVRLMPTSQYTGQKLIITLRSSHYLPSVYDLISKAPLIRVDEIPPSLDDILSKLK